MGRRSLVADIAVALTLALVMTVIFDLDQPGKGLIDVSQRPMYELRDRITGAAAPEAR